VEREEAPRRLQEEWGIRRGMRVEGFRAEDTSRNHSLRLLYFYYALVLYNACSWPT